MKQKLSGHNALLLHAGYLREPCSTERVGVGNTFLQITHVRQMQMFQKRLVLSTHVLNSFQLYLEQLDPRGGCLRDLQDAIIQALRQSSVRESLQIEVDWGGTFAAWKCVAGERWTF